MIIKSDGDEFKMEVLDSIIPHGDKPHERATAFEHLQDALNHLINSIQHVLDAFSHITSYRNYDNKSVKLNPIGQQFVKVWYHGPKDKTVFNVAVNNIGRHYNMKISYNALCVLCVAIYNYTYIL